MSPGASLRRRRLRLQTGVTKMVCRSVDWPIVRGGRSVTWAARRRSKGLKSPPEREMEVGLRAEIGTSSPPPLPSRRPKTQEEIAIFRDAIFGRSNPAPVRDPRLRKVRHSERKFTWCTERANHFFSKNPALANVVAASVGGRRRNLQEATPLEYFVQQDWFRSIKSIYHGLHRRCRALGITPEVLHQRPFQTVGQHAMTRSSVIAFIEVFLAVVPWEVDEIADLAPVCICDLVRVGTNRFSCRVHGKANRIARHNAVRKKRRT
jgi:hypothetical protein